MQNSYQSRTVPATLTQTDPQLAALLAEEETRQRFKIRLIASENYVSSAVREACASVITNQYSEGYPGARYYEGQQIVDQVERLAIDRAKTLFGAEHVNVQPHSGSPANLAVYLAFLKPGDTVLAMQLAHGGHLTHGSKASITGKYWNVVHYGLDPQTQRLNYPAIRELALQHRPKLPIAGHSAYPRQLDFAAFGQIADEIGAILMVDMAHFAGLVAGGAHPSPVPYADVVTTTTHKSLRGPRGGLVLATKEFADDVDRGCPMVLGGPLGHMMASKAIALAEARQPSFQLYAQQVADNAKALAEGLLKRGARLVTGGTDNHLVLVDVAGSFGLTGRQAEGALLDSGIVTNRNSIPRDPNGAWYTSGIRLGTPALTTRGFSTADMDAVAGLIVAVLQQTSPTPTAAGAPGKAKYSLAEGVADATKSAAGELLGNHPLYPGLEL